MTGKLEVTFGKGVLTLRQLDRWIVLTPAQVDQLMAQLQQRIGKVGK
jgi:hypothetical protein